MGLVYAAQNSEYTDSVIEHMMDSTGSVVLIEHMMDSTGHVVLNK